MKKLIKLVKTPGPFFRDYLNKKYPIIRNEIACPANDEKILIKHDMFLENKLPTEFPIDVVYTWVDNHDEKWQKKFIISVLKQPWMSSAGSGNQSFFVIYAMGHYVPVIYGGRSLASVKKC